MADGDLHITINHDTGERSVVREKHFGSSSLTIGDKSFPVESGAFYWPVPAIPLEIRPLYVTEDTSPNVLLPDNDVCHCCGKTGPHYCPNFKPE